MCKKLLYEKAARNILVKLTLGCRSETKTKKFYNIDWGARKLTGDNLRVV